MYSVEVGRIYQHFKGNLYLVTGTNINQDNIAIVEYVALYGSCQKHSRPLSQFRSEDDDCGIPLTERADNKTNQGVRFKLIGTGFRCVAEGIRDGK